MYHVIKLNRALLLNGLPIALVVGTFLNVINQYDVWLAGEIHKGQFVLNYLVPYCVATYSAMQIKREKKMHDSR